MRDNPPYSLSEIRLLLSQYLDGVLEASQILRVDALLNDYPEYQQEFLKLQATRAAIQNSVSPPEKVMDLLPEGDALWSKLSSQLQADAGTAPSDYPAEWISAYMDGEIPSQSEDFKAFERQLPRNAEANERLAQLRQVSETIKQFGYRQENQCSFEQSKVIIAQFQAEQAAASLTVSQAQPQADDTPIDPQWELLSGFVDQVLTPREMIQATQHIESSDLARTRLLQFNQISEGIQRISKQMQAQAPNVWPDIQQRLEHIQAQQKAADRARPKRLHWAKRATIPVAAAILLIVLSLPNLHIPGISPVEEVEINNTNGTGSSADSSLHSHPSASMHGRELASIPAAMTEGRHLRARDMATPGPMFEDSAPVSPIEKTSSGDQHLQPILEPVPAMASANVNNADRAGASSLQSDTLSTRGKAPSSDAYLFDALSKQMPDEDISNILGK